MWGESWPCWQSDSLSLNCSLLPSLMFPVLLSLFIIRAAQFSDSLCLFFLNDALTPEILALFLKEVLSSLAQGCSGEGSNEKTQSWSAGLVKHFAVLHKSLHGHLWAVVLRSSTTSSHTAVYCNNATGFSSAWGRITTWWTSERPH